MEAVLVKVMGYGLDRLENCRKPRALVKVMGYGLDRLENCQKPRAGSASKEAAREACAGA